MSYTRHAITVSAVLDYYEHDDQRVAWDELVDTIRALVRDLPSGVLRDLEIA